MRVCWRNFRKNYGFVGEIKITGEMLKRYEDFVGEI